MMPNVTRGARMKGLLEYLVGEGKANEHTEPHLVAGDGAVMAWHDDAVLSMGAAREVADYLDKPRQLFEVEVPRGSVWHCSLSLRSEEGIVDEGKWAEIAHDFVDGMGFTETSGKAGCRWVAVHHGQSKEGNDHIHIAVSLVREDGTKASVWNDYKKAQTLAGALEKKYDLQVLESRGAQRGDRGVTPAEIHKAQRQGEVEPERTAIARTVRGCAGASREEGEFVRRARGAGLLVRARYAAGRDDVIEGYSVARRPARGERPIWFGGGHLAKDLTLPRLRQTWTDSPQAATAAAAEWNAARRHRRPVAPGRETHRFAPSKWQEVTDGVARLREQLREVPVEDTATWARVAHQSAGAFAAWSLRTETRPGPLAAAADALASSASIPAHQAAPVKIASSLRSASLLLASAGRGGRGTVAHAVLLRQMGNVVKAIHDAHQAVGEAQRAGQILRDVRTNLKAVHADLPRPRPAPAPAPALSPELERIRALHRAAHPVAPGRTRPVLPADLESTRRHTHAPPGAGRDFGR